MSKKLKSRMLPLTVCLLAALMFSGCGKSEKEKEAMARLDAIKAETGERPEETEYKDLFNALDSL